MSKELKSLNIIQPKYIHLANHILENIKDGELTLNDQLPSVNRLSKDFGYSRETVFKALNHLTEKGIVESRNRLGYFVKRTDVNHKYRVYFLLDKLTFFKEELYYSFLDSIGDNAEVEIDFHHHHFNNFKDLILRNLNKFTHFVIITFLHEDVSEVLNLIPPEKRIIIDKKEDGLEGEYAMVYQDFQEEIYSSLIELKNKLSNYKDIVLVSQTKMYHRPYLLAGIKQFSNEFGMGFIDETTIRNDSFKKGNVYITLDAYDNDLVAVIEKARVKEMVIGKDIGVISLNDTPVKKILEGGITVISSDFVQMGKKAAEFVRSGQRKHIANPYKLIIRNSL